ncbi:hypothetical protein ACFPER_05575 [Agromyces aurantiacus]|uniref:Uncharacterized protein n=1 Tax=Agromyces aurantiacus TaxID=165814 RepID=A0ABV9R359_9MICO|nr:hypothetical protein [Agromyces aurantiacus]MBM7502928.1 hypothetical protein [Agromyces aurantiacus]
MSNRRDRRRYRKAQDRRVWVFSDVNRDVRPEQIARIITTAGLEQARLEAAARADDEAHQHATPAREDDHA